MEEGKSIMTANKNSNHMEYEVEDIKKKIYTIRGKQVMLDSDVASLYKYETKNINKAMKRNIERFPEDFCFQLSSNEWNQMWFQNGTTSEIQNIKYRSEKYLPYAYTEQGVAMLSGVLKNETAIQVSINIIRAFIEMRKFLTSNRYVFERLTNVEYKLLEHDKKIEDLFNKFDKEDEVSQKLFFDGQIWDSYNLIVNIIKRAESKILIIDNYIDDSILEMLSKKKEGVEVVIITSNKSNILKLDIQKFNKEYPTLKVAKSDKFHDKFIIIDNKELYHCGASLKDLGKKCFGINRIDDDEYVESLKRKTEL